MRGMCTVHVCNCDDIIYVQTEPSNVNYSRTHSKQAIDADGDLTPLSFEITNGNTLGHFRLDEPARP